MPNSWHEPASVLHNNNVQGVWHAWHARQEHKHAPLSFEQHRMTCKAFARWVAWVLPRAALPILGRCLACSVVFSFDRGQLWRFCVVGRTMSGRGVMALRQWEWRSAQSTRGSSAFIQVDIPAWSHLLHAFVHTHMAFNRTWFLGEHGQAFLSKCESDAVHAGAPCVAKPMLCGLACNCLVGQAFFGPAKGRARAVLLLGIACGDSCTLACLLVLLSVLRSIRILNRCVPQHT